MSDPQIDWLSDEFQAVFWSAKRALKEAADLAYRSHGVRNGQQFILMCLWDVDGLTPGEIARRLGRGARRSSNRRRGRRPEWRRRDWSSANPTQPTPGSFASI